MRFTPSLSMPLAVTMLAAGLTGCATVKSTHLRDDYAQVDQQRVKRLVVVTAPVPEGGAPVAALFGLITRRDLNLKRNFLVKHAVAGEALGDWKSRCRGDSEGEGAYEGVLHLAPTLTRKGSDVDAELQTRLLRCVDGEEVWSSKASGAWAINDSHVRELQAQYVSDLGKDVEPYVPAVFYIVRATIDAMPNPTLNDDDIQEKIELGD